MPIDTQDLAAVQTRLWDEIDAHHIGMLGPGGREGHFQPMTAFVDRAENRMWFFAYADSDIAEAARDGGSFMFVFQQPKLYACIGGDLAVDRDRERMDRYWNAAVAAWYPEGKDDPRLTLLRLDCADAQVWVVEAGPARYAWEVAKANATRKTPDVGGSTHLDFH